MRIVREEDRQSLWAKYQNHRQAKYICFALNKPHCYLADIDESEFARLLLNSSPLAPKPETYADYPSLARVILEIKRNPDFLTQIPESDYEGLNGNRVRERCDQFRDGHLDLSECFIIDKDEFPGMNPEGSFYIIDGIHRLVAFGLMVEMAEHHFPIQLYYCTEKNIGA